MQKEFADKREMEKDIDQEALRTEDQIEHEKKVDNLENNS